MNPLIYRIHDQFWVRAMRWFAAAAVGVAMMMAACWKPYQAEATLIGTPDT